MNNKLLWNKYLGPKMSSEFGETGVIVVTSSDESFLHPPGVLSNKQDTLHPGQSFTPDKSLSSE